MTRRQSFLAILAAGLLGAIGYLLFGPGPGLAEVEDRPVGDFVLLGVAAADSQSAAEVWRARQPWGGNDPGTGNETGSSSAQAGTPQSVQSARPVGTLRTSANRMALFAVPGQPLLRVQQGTRLPDGSEVLEVGATLVRWRDAQGSERTSRLLSGPAGQQRDDAASPDEEPEPRTTR